MDPWWPAGDSTFRPGPHAGVAWPAALALICLVVGLALAWAAIRSVGDEGGAR